MDDQNNGFNENHLGDIAAEVVVNETKDEAEVADVAVEAPVDEAPVEQSDE